MESSYTNKKMQIGNGNIFLVGMMGSGKTTIGRSLANYTGKTFVDSDHEIQERTGVKIPVIFDIEGETGFRRRETEVLQELVKMDNVVLATGGGAILSENNRDLLKRHGTVVYLRAAVIDLQRRTRHDKNRPLLQTKNLHAKLTQLLAERDEFYREAAHLVIDSSSQGVRNLVNKLAQQLVVYKKKKEMMQTITVDLVNSLEQRSYPIHIGNNLLNQADLILPHLSQKRVAIISNMTVAPLYLDKLRKSLGRHGVESVPVILPDGESYKNWETMNQIFDALLSHRCERNTTIVALGGGVVGDLTGFAAASFLRGVPFIQIPTTLLAQVDSSVGGKTGINHPQGKNMIGAFYQPKLVLADSSTLDTLPDRELRAGIAEVVKYGLIRDLSFFDWLEQNMKQLLDREPSVLHEAIRRSCEMKAEIVAADEKENGVRALLNLGHTFGHAIENGMGYGVWLHGEAVATGIIMAAELSKRLGLIDEVDVFRIRKIFIETGLPVVAPKFSTEKYLELMSLDKKVSAGKIRFILLNRIGEASMYSDIPLDALTETVVACTHE